MLRIMAALRVAAWRRLNGVNNGAAQRQNRRSSGGSDDKM